MTALRGNIDEELCGRLRAWRRHNIRIGLAGWSPAAWEGLLEREPYGGAAGYARMFPTALLRLGNAPLATQDAMLQRLPEDFGWTVECDHETMVYRFPYRHPDRNKRGERNAEFLDPGRVAAFAGSLQRTLGERLQTIIFRIAPVYRTEGIFSGDFLAMLTRCLDALPPSGRYAVQIGNPEFIVPDILDALGSRNVAHVAPAGGLLETVQVPGMLTADTVVAYSESALAFHALVRRCLEEGRSAYVYVHDGADPPGPAVGWGEGPVRLARLLAGLDNDLARRSPIKRIAA